MSSDKTRPTALRRSQAHSVLTEGGGGAAIIMGGSASCAAERSARDHGAPDAPLLPILMGHLGDRMKLNLKISYFSIISMADGGHARYDGEGVPRFFLTRRF